MSWQIKADMYEMYIYVEPITRKAYPKLSKEKVQASAKRDDYCKKS